MLRMTRPAPIRLDADTWAIMRNAADRPAAIVHRVTDTAGAARFLVLQWHLDPAKRRMSGIFTSLQDADTSVLYDNAAHIKWAQRKTSGPPNGGGSLHHSGAETPKTPSPGPEAR